MIEWDFTDTGPFATNDGSTESCDQGLFNDVFVLVCREVWGAYSALLHSLLIAKETRRRRLGDVTPREREQR